MEFAHSVRVTTPILTESALARMLRLKNATRSSTSGERAGAIRNHALGPLMLKWGVTDAQLNGANERIGAYQHADNWRGGLAHQMALAVGCRMYWATEDDTGKADAQTQENQERIRTGKPPRRFKWPQVRRIGFIGDTATVAALVRRFQAVESEVEAACAASYASLAPEERPLSSAAKKWQNNFRHGAVAALVARMLGALDRDTTAPLINTPDLAGWFHGWQSGLAIQGK